MPMWLYTREMKQNEIEKESNEAGNWDVDGHFSGHDMGGRFGPG